MSREHRFSAESTNPVHRPYQPPRQQLGAGLAGLSVPPRTAQASPDLEPTGLGIPPSQTASLQSTVPRSADGGNRHCAPYFVGPDGSPVARNAVYDLQASQRIFRGLHSTPVEDFSTWSSPQYKGRNVPRCSWVQITLDDYEREEQDLEQAVDETIQRLQSGRQRLERGLSGLLA